MVGHCEVKKMRSVAVYWNSVAWRCTGKVQFEAVLKK